MVKLLCLGFDALDGQRVLDPQRGIFRSWEGQTGIARPEIDLSAPSWTSIYTGLTRKEHGVLSCWGTRDTDRKFPQVAPCVWDRLNAQGLSCGVIGMPATWPARPVKGWMISGPWAPVLDARAIFPPGLQVPADYVPNYMAATKDMELRMQMHNGHYHEWLFERGPNEAWGMLVEMSWHRLQVALSLCKVSRVDCLFLGFSFPDVWGHISRDVGQDEGLGRHGRVDELALSLTVEAVRVFEPNYTAVISDHGFSVGHSQHGIFVLEGPGVPTGFVGSFPNREFSDRVLGAMGLDPNPEVQMLQAERVESPYSPDEEQRVLRHLRGLGYIS